MGVMMMCEINGWCDDDECHPQAPRHRDDMLLQVAAAYERVNKQYAHMRACVFIFIINY